LNNSNLTMFIQRRAQPSINDSSWTGSRVTPTRPRTSLNCHDGAQTGATPITRIDRHVDHAKTISIQSRPCVVVVDIAASSRGALSVLKDFTDFLALQDVGVDWVCLVSSDEITSSVPWVRVVKDVYPKRSWIHRLIWEICVAPRLVQRYAPDAVFSLQNTAVAFTKVPQVVYVHQPLPFARWHRWSFFRSEEREMAVRAAVLGPVVRWSVRKASTTIVQTHWMQQALAISSRVDSSRIVVAPECDVSLTAGDESDILGAACTRPGTNFFYPASALPYKNFEVAIQAIILLQAQGHHAELTLTITGKENGYAKRIMALAKPLGDAVQFYGSMPRHSVLLMLQQSILVFPSIIETFGLPPLEVRKLGSWVIAADTPFAREILDGYPRARLFASDSAADLASAMLAAKSEREAETTLLSVTRDQNTQRAETEQSSSWQTVVDIVKVKFVAGPTNAPSVSGSF
jgi:glycosyltransferase involved in cell wall biosynthesis